MTLYTLDASCLDRARRALNRSGSALELARERLLGDADRLCRTPPESVVLKSTCAQGGDAHDYFSLAPDAWPWPRRSGVESWQRRDGIINPVHDSDSYDARRLERMAKRCLTLGLGWYFSGQRVYAQAAAEQIRCWFIDPETRMRPHLNFAHAVPGEIAGQGSGQCEARHLWMVIDTLGLLATSGVIDGDDETALRLWFATFSDWMFHSDTGLEGFVWHDWRGTSHDALRVVCRLFCGEPGQAAKIIRHGITLRLAAQFDREGKQSVALEGEHPFHASLLNLEAHLLLNRYAEHVDIDRWQASHHGRSFRPGVDYLLPFILEPDLWPWRDVVSDEWDGILRVLLQTLRGYTQTGNRYKDALSAMPEALLSRREWLLWYPGER